MNCKRLVVPSPRAVGNIPCAFLQTLIAQSAPKVQAHAQKKILRMLFVSKGVKKAWRGLGQEAQCLGEREEQFPRLGLHARCQLGNASHACGEQPHPGTANLMAGFQCRSQDARGWGGRLARGGEKARKCHRGEDAFSGLAKACFVSLPSASCHFPEAGSVTKK